MATHSSILAWRIPGTEEPGGLLSMGLHRGDLAAAAAECKLYHKVILIKKVWYWHKKQTPKSVEHNR